jgi:hypothetical protein
VTRPPVDVGHWILRYYSPTLHPREFVLHLLPDKRPVPSGNLVQPDLMNEGQITGWVRTNAPVDLAAQLHRRGLILRDEGQMAESQLSELQNMRVLLEDARLLARNLAYHRRARLEEGLGQVLDEIDRQIEELRSDRG